jgi:hypothetical protein
LSDFGSKVFMVTVVVASCIIGTPRLLVLLGLAAET